MKRKLSAEKVCFRFMLLFAFQIGFILIMKTSNTATPERKRYWPVVSSSPSHSSMLLKQPDPAGKPIVCDRSHRSYDWCHLKLRTILEPTSATFFTVGSPAAAVLPLSWEKIRPYPRKTDSKIMSNIREITLTTAPLHTPCEVHHNTPALVFSTGGFTGNFFHDFNDGIIPLFVTINTLFPHDRDITIVVANYADWWHSKYAAILPQFSSRPIINLNNQTVTHCFPSAVAGLISHGSMTINPTLIPNGKTFRDFRALLEEGYRRCLVWPPPRLKGRPRLVLVTRAGTVGRVLMNRDNIVRAAQEAGFDVVVLEPSPLTYLCDIYRLINGSHAMVGVHGAALTHSLFLQPGSVLVQVVPLGNDWLAGTYFKNLARGLNLVYMEYKIRAEESSLVEKYGVDHVLVKDPLSIARRNWTALHDVYLKGQDVRVDVGRFRRCLRNAYSNAKRLMQAQGFHVRHRPRIRKYVTPLVFS